MVVLATAFAQVGTQSVREENERRPPLKRLLALFTLPPPAVDQSFRGLLSELPLDALSWRPRARYVL